MNKAVVAGRADGLFVEALGIELAAFDAGDLGADQRGAVLEILRAVLRPDLELLVMGGQRLQMRWPLARRMPRRTVPLARAHHRNDIRPPRRMSGDVQSSRCAFDAASMARRIVAGIEARLQLADPVPAFGKRQDRGLLCKWLLEPALVELLIVEGAECRRQAAQRPDQPELRGDEVDDETEPRLPRELEPMLGFALHVAERIAASREGSCSGRCSCRPHKVRSPILFAASKARRTKSRPVRMCFVQGMTRFPKDM